jgi:hypothetical protein
MVVDPDLPPDEAVIATVPFFSAVTSPLLLTVALLTSALDQVTVRPVNTLLRWS